MALAHSPKIVTDGLVLALDVGSVKSYPGIGYSMNAAISDVFIYTNKALTANEIQQNFNATKSRYGV